MILTFTLKVTIITIVVTVMWLYFRSLGVRKKKSAVKTVANIHIRKLYPRHIDEFIGHNEIIQEIKIHIHNFLKYGNVFPHTLFYGSGGLGKTTLSELIAVELKVPFSVIIGESLKKPSHVETFITDNIHHNGILMVDEIHRMKCFESFYSVLQDFKLFTRNGQRILLPEFTFIGATTAPEMLDKPFLQRFPNKWNLMPYTDDDIINIILNKCRILDVGIDSKAAEKIAEISQGIVRVAVNDFLPAAKAIALYKEKSYISLKDVIDLMKMRKIDLDTGISLLQKSLLKILYEIEQPVGLKNLSEIMDISPSYLSETVEIPLIRKGLLLRSPRGRKITTKGKKIIE